MPLAGNRSKFQFWLVFKVWNVFLCQNGRQRCTKFPVSGVKFSFPQGFFKNPDSYPIQSFPVPVNVIKPSDYENDQENCQRIIDYLPRTFCQSFYLRELEYTESGRKGVHGKSHPNRGDDTA